MTPPHRRRGSQPPTLFPAGGLKTLPIWIFESFRLARQVSLVNVAGMVAILLSVVPVLIARYLKGSSVLYEGGHHYIGRHLLDALKRLGRSKAARDGITSADRADPERIIVNSRGSGEYVFSGRFGKAINRTCSSGHFPHPAGVVSHSRGLSGAKPPDCERSHNN